MRQIVLLTAALCVGVRLWFARGFVERAEVDNNIGDPEQVAATSHRRSSPAM